MGFGIASAVVLPKKATSLTTPSLPLEYLEANPEITDRLYSEWQVAHKRLSFNPCSCVSYAKAKTGFSQVIGYAKNWPINSTYPTKGGVVITDENPYSGHVAYITEVYEDSFKVTEANFSKCSVTSRTIKLDDSNIKGFYYE